ncbi:hypothetical protein ACWEWK_02955 [Streptomyces sp. NPDC003757]
MRTLFVLYRVTDPERCPRFHTALACGVPGRFVHQRAARPEVVRALRGNQVVPEPVASGPLQPA